MKKLSQPFVNATMQSHKVLTFSQDRFIFNMSSLLVVGVLTMF